MDAKRLSAQKHLDPETESRCRQIFCRSEQFVRHCHEYYEIFLVTGGRARHVLRGGECALAPGALVFVRPDDAHDYADCTDDFSFWNLAVSAASVESLFAYLGDGFPAAALAAAPSPPTVWLGAWETRALAERMAGLTPKCGESAPTVRLRTRMLLAELLVGHFAALPAAAPAAPLWLEDACARMRRPENFIAGFSRLVELSGKTKEHLARSMKKYYGTTPSDFVTELRLAYAANLLADSDYNAADVCYECGFQNLSWFYTAFTKKYGEPPARFAARARAMYGQNVK